MAITDPTVSDKTITLPDATGTVALTSDLYTHPSHPGDDISVDTGVMSSATVISDLDFNVTTDTLGHVTDANGTVSTRTLTLANLGYTGATNANYITDNNQLANGANYITDGNTNWNNSYGFITASSSDTLTNKGGNISQWTNDVGYVEGDILAPTFTYTNANSSSGPRVNITRDSSSPAVDDEIGQLTFSGNDSSGFDTPYVRLQSYIRNPANASETGSLDIQVCSGSATPATKLSVTSTGVDITGALTATTKSFDIEHPTKEGKRLIYGSLEGAEHGVYTRGKLDNSDIIELPDDWEGLVDKDTITVQLTAIGGHQDLWVEEVVGNTVKIGASKIPVSCFYLVHAERKDVDKLQVEVDA